MVHRDWLQSEDVERIARDPSAAAALRNQVRALLRAHPEVVLFPGHDVRHLPTVSTRPDIVVHAGIGFNETGAASSARP